MLKKILLGFAGLVGLAALYFWMAGQDPINHREHAKVRSAYNQAHQANKQAMDSDSRPVLVQMKNNHRPDRQGLWNSLVGGVKESVGLDNDEMALHARLNHQIPLLRDYYVAGGVIGWRTQGPVAEALHFISPKRDTPADYQEQICSGEYRPICAPVTGIPFQPAEGNRTLAQLEAGRRGVTDSKPGNYRALLGRFCDAGNCTDTFPTTTEAFFCGGRIGKNFQTSYNGIAEVGGLENWSNYTGNRNGFSFELFPDQAAQAACAANPGAQVVYPGQSATGTMLVALKQ